MKRVIQIVAQGIDLTITIEGTAPHHLVRKIAHETQNAGLDLVDDVVMTDEVYGETVQR